MVETQSPQPIIERMHFGTFFVKDVHPVIAQSTRTNLPSSVLEREAEQLVALVERKRIERASLLVESPLFPGNYLEKTGTQIRIERENARPWENIVDYLIRRYRVEQAPLKILRVELGMTTPTIRRNLLSLRIPLLKSSEYKNPMARAAAAAWENSENRLNRIRKLQQNWRANRDRLMARTQSLEAREKRKAARNLHPQEFNENTRNGILAAHKTLDETRQRRMEDVLGEDPFGKMQELRVERDLSIEAAVSELGNKISSSTLSSWILRNGIVRNDDRARKLGTDKSRVAGAKFLAGHRELWGQLPLRQMETVLLLFDEKGRIRKLDEIGVLMGVTKAAVSASLIGAKANIGCLIRGETILNKRGRPRTRL